MSDITIRTQLQPGDLGYVAYLHGWRYAEENQYGLSFEAYVLEGLAAFAHAYDPAKDGVWICEQAGKIIGFLAAAHQQGAVQLRYFLLLPAYRGLGLGKRLMLAFVDFMKEKGYRKAFLWTTQEQSTAKALYTRAGFRLTEEKISETLFNKQLVEQRYDLELE